MHRKTIFRVGGVDVKGDAKATVVHDRGEKKQCLEGKNFDLFSVHVGNGNFVHSKYSQS